MFLRIGLSLLICIAVIACPIVFNALEITDPAPVTENIVDVPEEAPDKEIIDGDRICASDYLVTKANVNLRSGAGTDSKIIATLEKGGIVCQRGQEGDWFVTVYKGKTAYIHKKYVTRISILKTDDKTEKVISVAETLLGYTYVYGAKRAVYKSGVVNKSFDPTLFDCSSLTQYCYYKGAGVVLGATTREQYYDGQHVDFDRLKRGDLMLFTNSSRAGNSGIERIGHVAIYLGDGYILHTASDFARIEKLSQKRKNNFIIGVRVIN